MAGCAFLANLGGYDLWPPDEPRFAQVAREMMTSGDYLSPSINGRPYLEKPPLQFWITAALSLPFGDVNEWTARAPSVIAALLTLVLTSLLAARMYGRNTALLAVLILLSTQRFWWQARVGQLDMLLTFWVTLSLYALWRWHEQRQARYQLLLLVAMSAGLLTKGPPALVFPVLTLLAFYWKRPADRKPLHPWLLAAAACGVALAWLIPARLGISAEMATPVTQGISENLFRQTIGRFFFGVNHAQWPWYYLLQLPIDLLPWSLFLPWVAPWVWRQRRASQEMRFLLSWLLPAFIFFSICIGKRSVYLLPLFPVISILFAVSLRALLESGHAKPFRFAGALWSAALLVLSPLPFLVRYTEFADVWSWRLPVFAGLAVLLGGAMAWNTLRQPISRIPIAIAATFAATACAVAWLIFPAVNIHKSARDFCAPLREMTEASLDFQLYSLMFSREEYIYYAKRHHQPVPDDLDQNYTGMEQTGDVEAQRLLRRLQRETGAVKLESMLHLQPAERQALEEAVADIKEHLRLLDGEGYRSIHAMFSNFFQLLAGTEAAFIIVQERDWRWILPLFPNAEELHILHHERVGAREVLLLANATGYALWQATDFRYQQRHD